MMARVVLYDRPAELEDQEGLNDVYGERGGDRDWAERDDPVRPGDAYLQRLTKYIPAETLAFVILGTSFPDLRGGHVAAVVAVGAVGQVLWLFRNGEKLPKADRPTARYYLLSLVAYGAWVLGTCPSVAALIGVDRTSAAIALVAVAFLLPWVDPKTHAWLDPTPPERPLLRR